MSQLQEIKRRITAAATLAGRDASPPCLIAVSKKQPAERITSVLEEGHRVFGENRVQEAAQRWPSYREEYGDIDLHLLGPLQTNKVQQAIKLFGTVHSLDRPKLADAIARAASQHGTCPDLFIQVNTGQEAQKAGVIPGELDAFVAQCRALELPVIGLMCLPPVNEPASLHFALLAKLAGNNGLAQLSMGMSGDYEEAIAHGATHVRVGSAIFGERPAPMTPPV